MAYSAYNVSLNGGIYAKSTGVTNESANQIADYSGAASITMTSEHVEWRGQSFWVRDAVLVRVGATLNFASVLFKPETFGTIWGITATAGSTKEATPATATVYELDTSYTTTPELEFLVDVDRSSDSKKFQIWAAAGRLTGDFPISFTQGEYMVHDIGITCFTNSSNQMLQIIKETTA